MISIRPVHPEEASELTEIALAAKRHWGYPERWMELWAPQLTFTAEYFKINESWVAAVQEKPVAFYTLINHDEIGWLENLWVHPEYIGKGIGRELFLHAVKLSRERKFKILQLEADPNAASFYEKMGMRKIGERHHEVDGQPRVLPVMEMKV